MPLRPEVSESLIAKMSDVHRSGQTALVRDLASWLRHEFPDITLSQDDIEGAIIRRAKERSIPVEFDTDHGQRSISGAG